MRSFAVTWIALPRTLANLAIKLRFQRVNFPLDCDHVQSTERRANMDQREQQIELGRELGNLLDRYAMEWDMTYESIIGCLELKKLEVADFLLNGGEDEDYE